MSKYFKDIKLQNSIATQWEKEATLGNREEKNVKLLEDEQAVFCEAQGRR